MATHYIPRNVKGEGRLLYIFSARSIITTAIGGGIGLFFYFIFKLTGLNTVGLIFLAIFAVMGFLAGTIKIPVITGVKFTKNVAGDYINDVIIRFFKFNMNKKIYKYVDTKEEEVNGDK